MLELIQLLIGISTSLYLPAMGTAGLDLLEVKGYNLVPAPPPRITAKTDLAENIYLLFFFIVQLFIICSSYFL
jgi:hypothetical protein